MGSMLEEKTTKQNHIAKQNHNYHIWYSYHNPSIKMANMCLLRYTEKVRSRKYFRDSFLSKDQTECLYRIQKIFDFLKILPCAVKVCNRMWIEKHPSRDAEQMHTAPEKSPNLKNESKWRIKLTYFNTRISTDRSKHAFVCMTRNCISYIWISCKHA